MAYLSEQHTLLLDVCCHHVDAGALGHILHSRQWIPPAADRCGGGGAALQTSTGITVKNIMIVQNVTMLQPALRLG